MREPNLTDALVPLGVLVVLVGGALLLFGLDALDGPLQVALVLCAMSVALVAMRMGHRWLAVQKVSQGAMSSITSAVFILLAVGALIGVWNLSGTIPTLVYYGIQVLSPSWYYAATALICGAIAMSIGSSWTTARSGSAWSESPTCSGCRPRSPRARSSPAPISGTSSRRCRRRRCSPRRW
ncbi:hypothetical protein ACKI1Q_27565 [Streptomyces galilaeus]|uniref:hypothetical protein n=1 Tax=Streptomyces TaxID=1883 RepID=UPI003800C604